MTRQFLALCAALIAASTINAQTLRIRSNSIENLHVVAVGTDKAGHYTSKTIYDFYQGQWKTLSFYKVKFGYDAYHNKEMIHDGYDPTSKWASLLIYDNSNTLCGKLDLTQPAKRISLGNTKVWAKIKQAYDRDYLITDVILNDD